MSRTKSKSANRSPSPRKPRPRACTAQLVALLERLPAFTLRQMVRRWEEVIPHLVQDPWDIEDTERLRRSCTHQHVIEATLPLLAMLPSSTVGGIERAIENAILDDSVVYLCQQHSDCVLVPNYGRHALGGLAEVLRRVASASGEELAALAKRLGSSDTLSAEETGTGGVDLPAPIRQVVEMLRSMTTADQWVVLRCVRETFNEQHQASDEEDDSDDDGYDGWLGRDTPRPPGR